MGPITPLSLLQRTVYCFQLSKRNDLTTAFPRVVMDLPGSRECKYVKRRFVNNAASPTHRPGGLCVTRGQYNSFTNIKDAATMSLSCRFPRHTIIVISLIIIDIVGPIPWGHSGPLCHALSLLLRTSIDFTLPFTRCRYCRSPPAL